LQDSFVRFLFYRIGNYILFDKKPQCEPSSHWDDALARKVFICLRQNVLAREFAKANSFLPEFAGMLDFYLLR
jgi:hypothetical protein